MNSTVKWQDGTCDGQSPRVGLLWANGTLFSQLQSSSIDSHGNTDEGPSTLYLLLLLLYPHLFIWKCTPFSWASPTEMASRRNGWEFVWKNRTQGIPEKKKEKKHYRWDDIKNGSERDIVYLFTNYTCFQEVVKKKKKYCEWRKSVMKKWSTLARASK